VIAGELSGQEPAGDGLEQFHQPGDVPGGDKVHAGSSPVRLERPRSANGTRSFDDVHAETSRAVKLGELADVLECPAKRWLHALAETRAKSRRSVGQLLDRLTRAP
jgi:hypothetical protein